MNEYLKLVPSHVTILHIIWGTYIIHLRLVRTCRIIGNEWLQCIIRIGWSMYACSIWRGMVVGNVGRRGWYRNCGGRWDVLRRAWDRPGKSQNSSHWARNRTTWHRKRTWHNLSFPLCIKQPASLSLQSVYRYGYLLVRTRMSFYFRRESLLRTVDAGRSLHGVTKLLNRTRAQASIQVRSLYNEFQ
jgi:hypothetical protein